MFTLEDVRAAFSRNGFTPEGHHIHVENNKCCALGALCDGRAFTFEDAEEILHVNKDDLVDFSAGFDKGFHEGQRSHPYTYRSVASDEINIEAYQNGFDIGVAL